MENNNEIGKAIKDKLMNLDKTPRDFVWSRIEKNLDKKKRKRFLLWLIPSVLLIGVLSTVGIINYNNQNKISNVKISNDLSKSTTIGQTEGQKRKIEKESAGNDTILVRKSKSVKLVKQSSKLVASTNEYEEYEVVKKYKITIKKEKIHIKTTPKVNIKAKSTQAKLAHKPLKRNYSNITGLKSSKPTQGKNSARKITKQKSEDTLPKETASLKVTVKEESKIVEIIPPQLEEKKDSIITIDSTHIKKRRTSKIEEKSTEKIVVNNSPERRIHVYYGPAVFSSLNNESLIDPSLSKQPKSKPVSSFYGVYIKIMYKRAGFRVGFSNLNLKTSTQLNQDELIPSYSNVELKSNLSPTIIRNTFANSNDIKLTQTLSYYELPIEFNYAIKKDKSKFNVEAFGGISTMILDGNILEISSNEIARQNIGSSRNISKINASTNIGIGFSYELTKKLQFEINPLFKYYFNTFKDNNNAKPYSLSLQSGLSYKF